MNSILIVEDDEKLRNELGIFLGNNGYSIKYMDKFDNTISEILNSKCDLILLDINLTGWNGDYPRPSNDREYDLLSTNELSKCFCAQRRGIKSDDDLYIAKVWYTKYEVKWLAWKRKSA